MNALNPKTDLLIKLASFISSQNPYATGTAGLKEWPDEPDQDIVEWLDRMAELKFITARPHHKRQEGYQVSAQHPTDGPIASYTEATHPANAMQVSFREFPEDEYTNHAVKNIESQEEIFLPSVKIEPSLSLAEHAEADYSDAVNLESVLSLEDDDE